MDQNERLIALLGGENPLGRWVTRMRDVIGITAKELADATGVRPNYLSMLDTNGPSYATGTAQNLLTEISRHLGLSAEAAALTLQAGLVLSTIGAGRTVGDRARVAGVLLPALKAAVSRRTAEMLCEAHVAAVPYSGSAPRRKRNRRAATTPMSRVIRQARLIEPRRILSELRMREDELIDERVQQLARSGDCAAAMAHILDKLRAEEAEAEARDEANAAAWDEQQDT